ncbi:MAG: VCBS repeat-containing protein [Rhizobiales bacterium]|nr:VCBS repeat-containing protein [Hyphomicrobiales bacterium]
MNDLPMGERAKEPACSGWQTAQSCEFAAAQLSQIANPKNFGATLSSRTLCSVSLRYDQVVICWQRKFWVVLLIAIATAQGTREEAVRLYREGKLDPAAKALRQYLENHPSDVSSQLLLGLCEQQLGRHPEAELSFSAAITADPKNAAAYFYRARNRFLRGRFDTARPDLAMARSLGHPTVRIDNLAARIFAEEGETVQAMAVLDRTIAAAPQDPEAHLTSGKLLMLTDGASAMTRLFQATRLDPSSAEALYWLARVQIGQGRSDEAVKHLGQVLKMGPHREAEQLLSLLRRGAIASSATTGAAPKLHASKAGSFIRLRNVATAAGLGFRLENQPTPQKYLIETMPGGVSTFDFDNDGLTDIFFANGASVPSLEKTAPTLGNRLYRNLGGWRFKDVTAQAGLEGSGYAMAVAAADYDNDGRVDLFVSGVNHSVLYRNLGNGNFADVGQAAGVRPPGWAVGGAWLDFDLDGLLDLFVVRYVDWSRNRDPAHEEGCRDPVRNLRVYCHPSRYTSLPNALYRNRGDGTFEEVSVVAGIAAHPGKGMSATVADYDGDGDPDVFVANDTLPNFLFQNDGGKFREVALAAGVAYGADGKPVSSMGSEFQDIDGDGLPDIVVTALAGETFLAFRNVGGGSFLDHTRDSGLASVSIKKSGWGVLATDFDNDGGLELFTANSHVSDNISVFTAYEYAQHNSIFSLVEGRFVDRSAPSGLEAPSPAAHRGAALADFDNDGRLDLVVVSLGGATELWRNESPRSGHWLQVRLTGVKSNRDGMGACVRVLDAKPIVRCMTTSRGYASSSHMPLHFGLGAHRAPLDIEVRWPSGTVQRLKAIAPDRLITVKEERQSLSPPAGTFRENL